MSKNAPVTKGLAARVLTTAQRRAPTEINEESKGLMMSKVRFIDRFALAKFGYKTKYLSNGNEIYTYRDGHRIEADAEGLPLRSFDKEGVLTGTYRWPDF